MDDSRDCWNRQQEYWEQIDKECDRKSRKRCLRAGVIALYILAAAGLWLAYNYQPVQVSMPTTYSEAPAPAPHTEGRL